MPERETEVEQREVEARGGAVVRRVRGRGRGTGVPVAARELIRWMIWASGVGREVEKREV